MSDIIISANRESALLQSLYKVSQNDPFTYYNEKNFPNLAKYVVSVSPQSTLATPLENKTQIFKIPQYGLISKGYIKSDLTLSSTNVQNTENDNNLFGSRLFNNIKLSSNSTTIFEQTPNYTLSRLKENDINRSVYNKYINPSITMAVTGTTPSMYIPLMFPYFENTQMFLDSNFLEQMELSLTVNSFNNMGISAITSGPSALSNTLYLEYVNLENSVLAAYRSSNFGQNTRLNMLVYDTYNENAKTLTGDETSVTIDLKCPYVVFETHAYIHASLNRGDVRNITAVKFTVSGRSIYETLDSKILALCAADMGKCEVKVSITGVPTISNDNQNVTHISLYHGIENNRTSQTGAIYMNQTNNPQLVLSTLAADLEANDVLEVNHLYWSILSIGNDGRIFKGNSL